MANLPSVEKRNRQSIKRRARNQVTRRKVKGVMKIARQAVEGKGGKDSDKTAVALKDAMRVLGKAKSKGVLHARTASRKISRLAKSINKAAAAAPAAAAK